MSASIPMIVWPSEAMNSLGAYCASVATVSVPFDLIAAGTCAAIVASALLDVVVAVVAVELVLLRREHDYLHWLWPIMVGIVGAAVLMMAWQPRVARTAILAAVAMLLVAPAVYSATVWQVPVNGTFPASTRRRSKTCRDC